MQYTLNVFRSDLLDLLTKDAKLTDLLNVGYKIFGNPLMIFNHRGEVLSKSNHQPYHDPDWEEAEHSCFYAREKFSSISSHNFSKINPMLMKENKYRHKRLVAKLPGISDRIYLAMLEIHQPFSPADHDLFMILANAISIKLRKRKRSDTFWIDTHELFISNLLQGKICEESTARDYARNFSIHPKGCITLIMARSVIELGESDINKLSPPLSKILPDCRTSIYKGDLIILVFKPGLLERASTSLEKLEEFFQEKNLQGCIGLPVEEFLDLKTQYQHASVTLKICSRLRVRDAVVFYEQFAVPCLLNRLEVRDMELFCHPGILKLSEHDRIKGSTFIPTLYAYIIMHGNRSDAAKLLCISANTLKSRLSSMEAYLGKNWVNNPTVFYLSLKALFLLNPSSMENCKYFEQMKETIRR